MSEIKTASQNRIFESNFIKAQALQVAESISIRGLKSINNIYNNPVMVKAGIDGIAVIFKFGSIIFFNTTNVEQSAFLQSIEPHLQDRFKEYTSEEINIKINGAGDFSIINSEINCPQLDIALIVLISDALAKSVVLERIENSIAKSFETAESIAGELKSGHVGKITKINLLKQMGESLTKKQSMFNRMEISDKPDILWDNPNLEATYRHLSNEYELIDRQNLLIKKLDLILTVSQTGFDIVQTERALRVEWYIVILIVLELMLSLKDLIF